VASNAAHDRDPIEEEGLRLLEEDPELLDSLQEFERRYRAGEVRLIDHSEVRRRLGLDREPPEPER
jgi:hypothetical protein